jgi:cytochrome c oxidase cbb3-type subunit III
MSSRFPERLRAVAALALGLALAGCTKGAQGSEGRVPGGGLTRGQPSDTVPGVEPGIMPQMVLGDVTNPYAGNAGALATGRQLFVGFNCAGCHAMYGGGGMGPNLRDSLWIYGKSDAQIFSSIAEGRAYGMPAWGGKLSDELIWRLVGYVKSLSTEAEPDKPPRHAKDKVMNARRPRSAEG